MDAVPATAQATLAALQLLDGLRACGLRRLVLCPGSRSAPLAVAASLLEQDTPLRLYTAIDERAAAFFALGLARAEGVAVAVITTSGSAVANLLPALVEADQGTIPLLLLTADRPSRLKGCGANQTVNQEAFLQPCCRWVGLGAGEGLATMTKANLHHLAFQAMAAASGDAGAPPGPVHLNLPFEEPLHPNQEALRWLHTKTGDHRIEGEAPGISPGMANTLTTAGRGEIGLDPAKPGVVVAGPWRGKPSHWQGHLQALVGWQRRSGWPVLADALSGLRGRHQGTIVAGYDLLLASPALELEAPQVLRLGPLPSSRSLQNWLGRQRGPQVLVSEGDPRPMDPLKLARGHWPGGLARWPGLLSGGNDSPSLEAQDLCRRWQRAERQIQSLLDTSWGSGEKGCEEDPIEEPWLARDLSQRLPAGLPVMLANSSPVRDWESFADPAAPGREIFSFRGASGIDGTLSMACGLAEAVGEMVLISGDLALQHDSNGWLWVNQLRGRLLVVVIDNGGGGIFEQLPIRPDDPRTLDFERLFAMPQGVNPSAVAAAHGVPAREVHRKGELGAALAWGLAQPLALLRVSSDRRADAERRRQLRTMAAELPSPR